MADLVVSVSEKITLNGKSQGGTVSKTITGINDCFKRIVTITDVEASLYTTTTANQYISGSGLYIQTVTSTANDNTWETISVSGSFDKNRELELVFYNQQTGSDSISSFSDLEIT